MRAVVDTDILVRSIIKPTGTVGPVLKRLDAGEYTLLHTEPLLEELTDVLSRTRIRVKYRITNEEVQTVLQLARLHGEAVVAIRRITVCRDAKDNKVLEAAIAGNADVIVSGDDDLLSLSPFEGIPIVGPATFLRMLDREKA